MRETCSPPPWRNYDVYQGEWTIEDTVDHRSILFIFLFLFSRKFNPYTFFFPSKSLVPSKIWFIYETPCISIFTIISDNIEKLFQTKILNLSSIYKPELFLKIFDFQFSFLFSKYLSPKSFESSQTPFLKISLVLPLEKSRGTLLIKRYRESPTSISSHDNLLLPSSLFSPFSFHLGQDFRPVYEGRERERERKRRRKTIYATNAAKRIIQRGQ